MTASTGCRAIATSVVPAGAATRRVRRKQGGFSLLEIVVAFVIFALAFGLLMQIMSTSLKNTRRSAAATEAALLARSKLDEVGMGEKLDEGVEAGRFDNGYRWSLDVRKLDAPPSSTGLVEPIGVDLYRLELVVSWDEGNAEREARFATERAIQPDAGSVSP
jgi:general secretion pathway protein I